MKSYIKIKYKGKVVNKELTAYTIKQQLSSSEVAVKQLLQQYRTNGTY